MPGPGGPRSCGAAGKPTASTHLRQQQADLLHLLQRQQRVADRVLEEHVQQHLEREPGRERQRGSRVHPAPLPGQTPAPARAPARTQAQTSAFASPAPATTPHHGARSWPGSQCGEWAPARGTGLRKPRLRAAGQSETGDDTFEGLRRGAPRWYRPEGGRWERERAGCLASSAAARVGLVAGDARDAAWPAGRKAVWEGAFPDNIPAPGLHHRNCGCRARQRPGGRSRAGRGDYSHAETVAEPAFRNAGDLEPRTPPCSPRLPGPLRPRLPLGDHTAPADGSGAWGAMAQTWRKRLFVARFELFGCILFITLKNEGGRRYSRNERQSHLFLGRLLVPLLKQNQFLW